MNKTKHHILQLNFEKTWRGGERQTLYNMLGFKNEDCYVELLCRKNYPLETEARKQNFTTHAFSSALSIIWFLITKGKNYDVLHAQTSHILTYCILTKPFHTAQVLFSKRVDFVPKGFLTKLKYKLTTHVTVISPAIKTIFNSFGINHVHVVSDIVEPQKLNKQRVLAVLKNNNIPQDKKIIGSLAAFVPHKDPHTLIEAIKILSEKRSDFIFLHFGEGELKQAIQQKINKYHLQNRYYLMGFHQQAEDFFSVLDGFVMSSQEEGLGSSVLDAFLYEVPVASTNAGGLKTLVDNNRGAVCNIHSPNELADCIETIINRTTETEQRIKNAKQYALNFHSMKFITNQYLQILK